MTGRDEATHGILLVDRDGRFSAVMPFDATDRRYEPLVGAPVGSSAATDADRAAIMAAYGEALVTGTRVSCDYRTQMAGGKTFRVDISRFPPTEVVAIMLASEDRSEEARHDLTAREVSILKLSAADADDAAIAAELKIAKATVGRHKQNIRGKLGVSNWAAAVAWAVRNSVI